MNQEKYGKHTNEQIRHTHRRRIRHFLIIAVAFLLVLSVGTVTYEVFDKINPYTLSKSSGYVQSSAGTLSSIGGKGSSAASIQSKPSSAQNSSSVASSASSQTNVSAYQGMYPDMHTVKPALAAPQTGKVVYLTFDDGPSNLTMPLLNVLDRYHVKATFFLVGKTGSQDIQDMKEIVQRGHSIGMHSYTHQYKAIYKNPVAFLDDFKRIHDLILNTTGVDTHIYRFPGGSVNGYNRGTAKAIIAELNRRGYTYFDWNVSSGDAEVGTSAAAIYNNVIRGVHANPQSVVLCHNTNAKGRTLAEMPKIIETLLKQGYTFKTLDDTVDNAPYIFRIPK